MQVATKSARRACMAASILLSLFAKAWAHPHVWVTVETNVVQDKDRFTALQHKWTFDEYYTAAATEELHKNSDGQYDRDQLAELAKINVDGLKEFGYFTYTVLSDQPVKLGDPRDYRIEYSNGALSLVFTLPFDPPLVAQPGNDLTILILDPTYFIAFEFAKTDPVRLSGSGSQSCKPAIAELAEGSPEAQRLSKAFAELGPDLGYTQIASISCTAVAPQ
jgi:ABC-type uncharacterized transport system substrate-binding protein